MTRTAPWLAAVAALACAPVPDAAPAATPAAAAPATAASPPAAAPPAAASAPRLPCVDAPFPALQPPPDEGFVMTQTPRARSFGAITCAGDREVWLDAAKRLRVCTIAKPTRVHGLALAGDNYTHFHADGRPHQTTLARAHELTTAAGVAVACAADFAVLTATGALEYCALARETAFGEVTCAAGEDVAFAEDGALAACTIAAPVHAMGATLPSGTRLSWHPGGALASVYRAEAYEIAGYRVHGEVGFHANGQLAHLTLAEPRTIADLPLEDFAHVWFHADGSPWHIEYVAKRGFMVHGEQWTDTRQITFDCAGRITADHVEHYQAPTGPREPH